VPYSGKQLDLEEEYSPFWLSVGRPFRSTLEDLFAGDTRISGMFSLFRGQAS